MRPVLATSLTLLVILVGYSRATSISEVVEICRNIQQPGFPRQLGGQSEAFASYAMTKRGKACQYVINNPVIGTCAVDYNPKTRRPEKCYACPPDGSECTEELTPPEEPLNGDCKYFLSNRCQWIKAKSSDTKSKCDD